MTVNVLLVEDDRVLREALADTLDLGGFAYKAVDSAEQALKVVHEEPFNLVISDVNIRAWTATSCWPSCAASSRNCRYC